MKLLEALEILAATPDGAPTFAVELACGFTPLHLQTFLGAELRLRRPHDAVEVNVGLYDDLLGSLERVADTAGDVEVAFAVVEWSDLDPRLGVRRLGGWDVAAIEDSVVEARRRAALLVAAIRNAAARVPVVCALPTLPLPPLFMQPSAELGREEAALQHVVAGLGTELAEVRGVSLLSERVLGPREGRRDVDAEIATGFPYTMRHASALAAGLAGLAIPKQPKKGLITDLDDTLWSGLVGEIGPGAVTWNDADGSHGHALYQQFLAALASRGVLVAVASKNDAATVENVFARPDLLLSKEAVFPFEVHWESKSESVSRILEQWNIAASDVVFVDDSPMELAEVQSVHPEIEAIRFPGPGATEILSFLSDLQDAFAKHASTEADALRLQSIRSAAELRESAASTDDSHDEFLRAARGVVDLALERERDERALELVNKTNQFNLNGRRLTDSSMRSSLEADGGFLLTISYTDKFGPLGKIAAVLGRANGASVDVDSWVMSCRAFSRRIEYHTLHQLYELFDAHEVVLHFEETDRNSVLQQFLRDIVGDTPSGDVVVPRQTFLDRAPELVHSENVDA